MDSARTARMHGPSPTTSLASLQGDGYTSLCEVFSSEGAVAAGFARRFEY